jgi:hypothetical protein
MARAILQVTIRSTLLAWLIWAVSFSLLCLALWLASAEPWLLIGNHLPWWYLPATLLGPWIVAAVGASIGLTGPFTRFIKLLAAGLALYIGLALLAKFTLSSAAQQQLWRLVFGGIGVGMVLATVWLFMAARRRALIGWPTMYVAASVGGALVAVVTLVWLQHATAGIPHSLYLLLVGLAALVVAPWASAPLAIAWNRTR